MFYDDSVRVSFSNSDLILKSSCSIVVVQLPVPDRGYMVCIAFLALLSSTFLQTLPELVAPLNGAFFISMQLSTDAVSTLRKVWVLLRLWKQHSVLVQSCT